MEVLKEVIVQHFRDFCYERVQRSSVDEKIQVAYEYLKSLKSLPVLQPLSSKSTTKAVEFRTIGNCEYRHRNSIQALLNYTKSVAFAPTQSKELAYAYANRSAALLDLGRFHECLLDINRALRENYPDNLKKKLLDRKKTCVANFQSMLALSRSLPHDIGQHLLLGKASLEELEESLNPDGTEPPTHISIPPPEIDFKNKTIPNASGKIKIKVTPDNKINVVATADIKPGEVLVVAEPFLSGLNDEYIFTHCANCFVRTEALIHCPNCSLVMYCGARCRENAFNKFHRTECEIFSMLTPENEDVSLMTWAALRVILVATKQGQKLDEIMNHPVYKFPLAKNVHHYAKVQFNSQDYSSAFHHGQFSYANNFEDFSSGLSLNPLLTVATWVYLLRHSSYFGEDKSLNLEAPFTNRELFVASCLLRSLQFDFRTIKEGYDDLNNVNEILLDRSIGHGLFPLLNALGHSCDPNVSMFSYENNLVCRSICPIKAGEQIFDCYDDPYYKSPKQTRISHLLEKYKFECKCKPCVRNWPVKEDLPSGFPKVVSDTLGVVWFQQYASEFRKLKNRLNYQDMADSGILEFLCEYLSILDKRFERPCREFIDCATLLQFSLSTGANFYHIING